MIERQLNKLAILLIQILKSLRLVFKKFYLFILVLVFSIIIIIDYRHESNFLKITRDLVMDFTYPVISNVSDVITSLLDSPTDFRNLINAYEQNIFLKEENNLLLAEYENLKHIIYENIELKKLLNFVNEFEPKYITAKVIGNVSGPYMRKSIISAGEINGIKKGQVVVNKDGLVGRILEVNKKTARILLINDFQSKIPVLLAESREKAITSGDNSASLELLYLPKDADPQIGEAVVTLGDEEFFPAGIIVGYVDSKNDEKVKMKIKANLNQLNFVSVIIK
ncbi:MAG: rod shape-determining protein MreC [Alphaproteobacteria bacterium]